MVDAALEHNTSHGSWNSEHSDFWNIFDQRESFAEVFQFNVRVVTAVVSILSGGTSLCLHVIFLVTIGVTRTLGSHVYHLLANAFMAEIVVAAVVVPMEVMNILASSPLSDTLCSFLALLRLLSVSVLLTSYALLAFFLMADVCHPNWIFLTGGTAWLWCRPCREKRVEGSSGADGVDRTCVCSDQSSHRHSSLHTVFDVLPVSRSQAGVLPGAFSPPAVLCHRLCLLLYHSKVM